jgi:hypothetical protein
MLIAKGKREKNNDRPQKNQVPSGNRKEAVT